MRRRRLTEASICLAIGVLITLSIAWTASAVPGVARLAATHTNGWYENADGVWLVSWRDSTLTSRISIWRALEDDDEMWLANRQDMRDMLSAIRAKLGPREVPAWARAGSARWEQVQGFGWPRRAMILGSNERTTFIGPAQIHDGRYVIPESVPGRRRPRAGGHSGVAGSWRSTSPSSRPSVGSWSSAHSPCGDCSGPTAATVPSAATTSPGSSPALSAARSTGLDRPWMRFERIQFYVTCIIGLCDHVLTLHAPTHPSGFPQILKQAALRGRREPIPCRQVSPMGAPIPAR